MENENSCLVPVTQSASKRKLHSCNASCIQSRPARWILLWNFSVLLTYKVLYRMETTTEVSSSSIAPLIANISFMIIAIFSPVAGLLTDVKLSRHKAVWYSSHVIIAMLLILSALAIAIALLEYKLQGSISQTTNTYILIGLSLGVLFFAVIYIIFIVNAFQFGMDQLHDASTQDSVSFIHWYVWIYYVCSLISSLSGDLLFYDTYYFHRIKTCKIIAICLLATTVLVSIALIILSLCKFHRMKAHYVLEQAGLNPYELVYKVTHFAYKHKLPLKRSAFTYCTEESPSRMDVGKYKFGGPFTNRQVEDVKAFWGVLKVILSIGPAFFLQTVTQVTLPAFAEHGNVLVQNNETETHLEGVIKYTLFTNGLLTPILVVMSIPLYLCCIRPYLIRHYTLGMMKRMALAISLFVLSLLCSFIMDLFVHLLKTEHAHCMFREYAGHIEKTEVTSDFPKHPLYQNEYFLALQHVISAITNMLLDIATLEFICSQSPYSMKGLLIGTCFSTKSLFQGLAVISFVPFGRWRTADHPLSCGSSFYLTIIIIGLLELALFCCIATKYKYRKMNEPAHEYRYAENYYSNIQ